MKTRFLLASLLLVLFLPLQAQRPAYGKMSPMVRKMVRQHERQLRRMPSAAPAQNETDDFHTCVFIRITENASEVMALHQCRQLGKTDTAGGAFAAALGQAHPQKCIGQLQGTVALRRHLNPVLQILIEIVHNGLGFVGGIDAQSTHFIVHAPVCF